jgi:hypothetical protein
MMGVTPLLLAALPPETSQPELVFKMPVILSGALESKTTLSPEPPPDDAPLKKRRLRDVTNTLV